MTLYLTVAAIHIAALMTPGPDFFFVSQTAVSRSRVDAIFGALGIAAGIAVWVTVALLGLHALLEQLPWLHRIILFCGGSYLSWIGGKLLKSAYRPVAHQILSSVELSIYQTPFVRGVLTNLSNPKVLIFFGSIFVGIVGDDVPTEARWIIGVIIITTTFLWFAVVAFVFSLPAMITAYQQAGRWIDGVAGALFILFGFNLLLSALGIVKF